MELAANNVPLLACVVSTTSAHHSYQTLDSSDRRHILQFTVAPGGTHNGCFSGKYC